MVGPVLERDAELAALSDAVAAAAAGRGTTVLLAGEAGIGKTTLVRAFAERCPPELRLLRAGCDDLATPRPLGPLRDVAVPGGPLATALAAGEGGPGLLAELGEKTETSEKLPTVLVVEDVHWADDATLDVLLYTARRLETRPAVLVLTFRPDAVGATHPLQRLLDAVTGAPVVRLAPAPLSRAGVDRLAAGTGRDTAAVYATTGGNPFFVTEVLAGDGGGDLPATVVEAVLARSRRLGPGCRAAVEQLSVVPSLVCLDLAAELLGEGLEELAAAERAGMLVVRSGGLGFRHELARRAIEHSLPGIRRRQLHRAVLAVLHTRGDAEPARLVHHAAPAGDVATLIAAAPVAAREAARAGSHRQALAHFEAVLPHLDRLEAGERAAVLDEYGWELYNAHRFAEAVRSGREAVRMYGVLGRRVDEGDSLVRLSRHLFMTGDTTAAEDAARRAERILAATGDRVAHAHAGLCLGVVLALTGEVERAEPLLTGAHAVAVATGQDGLAALCLNYLGIVHAERGDPDGLRLLRESVAGAVAGGHHETAARGYTNLAELLFRTGRYADLDRCVTEGLAFTTERGLWSHAYNLEVHRCLLLAHDGDPGGAERELRRLADGVDDPGMLYTYSMPWLGRLRARRGDPAAGPMLAAAWRCGRRQRLLIGLVYAGLAYLEWAWLAGRPEIAAEVAAELLPRLRRPGAAPWRAELLRYLARAGLPAEPFPGCPEPWAAGLRGDWRAAAQGWRAAGEKYQTALELAAGGESEGRRMLGELGATAAAARVGGGRPARGPDATTRANPAGLTRRQLTVLRLLQEDLTNAEIADRLVVSVRTVDHHVAAILAKLGVRSRRQAAAYLGSAGVPSAESNRAGTSESRSARTSLSM